MRMLASLLVSIVVAMPSAAIAMSNAWERTASPVNAWPGLNNRAVLLVDGRVLLTGGSGMANKNEVFDPSTNTWSSVADLPVWQTSQTAVRLADGRVLLVAGCSPIYCVNSRRADLYDPASDTWSSAANFNGARVEPAAVLLADGRVLMVGGSASGGAFLPVTPAAEIYDPVTNTWTATSPMVATRTIVTATRLADGRVLVVGGGGNAEVFDPATGAWTATGNLVTPRIFQRAALLGDGRVLIAGGNGSGAAIASEIYDPASNSWSSAANMIAARPRGHTLTALADGGALVAGGQNGALWLDSAEVYDPALNAWSALAPMTVPHAYHFAAPLGNGRVFVVGGNDGSAQNASGRTAELSPLF